jgi:phosphate starvation-inducible protein PhoH and related proteins
LKRSVTSQIKLKPGTDTSNLFGSYDQHLKLIEKAFNVRIRGRGEDLLIEGDEARVSQVRRLCSDLADLVSQGFLLTPNDVGHAIRSYQEKPEASLKGLFLDTIPISTKKKFITPKSPTQKEYIDAIKKYDMVIGIGPAGTGKTYLAMAMAVWSLMKRETSRIILARPAVEAGEKLGFLPGDMYAKINPYLRPLYDALYDMMDMERANRLVERGEIEIAPLAYMRGRTLNDSFVILDEAQNSTAEQMKMFLTRLGFNSKVVITGDITQVDLPSQQTSGLVEIQDIITDISGIRFVYFTERDVVRHKLVQEIIKAYERYEVRSGKERKRLPSGR